MDRCSRCNAPVDTDFDDGCYICDDECVCMNCREKAAMRAEIAKEDEDHD